MTCTVVMGRESGTCLERGMRLSIVERREVQHVCGKQVSNEL